MTSHYYVILNFTLWRAKKLQYTLKNFNLNQMFCGDIFIENGILSNIYVMVCVLNVVTARTSISITSYWCMIQGIPFFHPLSFDIQLKKNFGKKLGNKIIFGICFIEKYFSRFTKSIYYYIGHFFRRC